MNYRRIPGTKVNYGRDATLYYVSPLARYQRGLNLSPALTKTLSASTREFWYRSQRAPDGYWRCKVSDNPFAPGGGGAGCPPPGATLLFGTSWCFFYSFTITYYVILYRADGTINRQTWSTSPPLQAWGPLTSIFWEQFDSTSGMFYLTCTGNSLLPAPASSIDEYPIYNRPSFDFNETSAEVSNISLSLISSTPVVGCTPGTDPDCSGGDPDETGDYGGLYYYLCDCPDKRRLQGALNRPRFASEAIARDWLGSRAGARNIPCKHIYATAAQVGDLLLLTPAPTGRPARESGIDPWELYRRLYDQWRKDYGQIHSAERRFQRAARRFTGRIEGRARAAARLQRKAFRDNLNYVTRLGRRENSYGVVDYFGNLGKAPIDPFVNRLARRMRRGDKQALGDAYDPDWEGYTISTEVQNPIQRGSFTPRPGTSSHYGAAAVDLPSSSLNSQGRGVIPGRPLSRVRGSIRTAYSDYRRFRR